MLQCPSLKDRVYRSSNVGVSPPVTTVHARVCVYKHWTPHQMLQAVNAVVKEGLSVRRAALFYGVPKSSLGDRISGRVAQDAVSGPPKYLTTTEEAELVIFLSRCATIGYAKSRKQVLALVQCILANRGITRTVSGGWWESFCRRHPNLTLRAAAPLSFARAKASDPEMFSRYFDLLEQTLRENHLTGKPGQIFNMDESGMPLDPKPPKLVVERGRSAYALGSGDKSQVTVVGCVSAAGFCIAPMVIWDRKTLAPELTIGEVPGTIYGLSSRGWMDQELFDIWFNNHFLKYAPSTRPLLLLLDGHSSHYCPDTIRLAAKERVILFTLPPNTTHLSQLLDKGCFGPLKIAWREICHEFMTENPGKTVTRYQFSALLHKAWMRSMTIANITSGFRVTGIYPFNREVFSFLDDHSEETTLSKDSGLAFIPLYSPASKRTLPAPSLPLEDQLDLDEESFLDEPDLEHVWLQPLQSTAVSKFLQYPSPPSRLPTFNPKSCGRVLTSSENLELLLEKEKAKANKTTRKKKISKTCQGKI